MEVRFYGLRGGFVMHLLKLCSVHFGRPRLQLMWAYEAASCKVPH
jgi:hypothetical protein